MAFLNSLVMGIDEVVRGLRDWAGTATSSYCDLESAVSPKEHIIAAKDGSCVSIVEWSGIRNMVGVNEYDSAVRGMTRSLSSAMSKKGHVVQVVFGVERSTTSGLSVMDELFSPVIASAKRLNLDLADVLLDRKEALLKHCAPEYCYVALWTRPTALPPAEWSKESVKHREKNKGIPRGKYGQTLNRSPQMLIDAHRSFVEFFARDLKAQGVNCSILLAPAALRAMRTMVDAEWTDESWTPHIPGDKINIIPSDFESRDISSVMWPTLPDQLIPRPPDLHDLRCVQVGDRLWAPSVVTVPQKNPSMLQDLFSRLRTVGVPWRISISISGDGLSETDFNASMANMLTIGSRTNALIDAAYKDLKELKARGDTIVGMRITAATWVAVDQPRARERLAENSARLATAMQSWGGCESSEVVGHPAEGFFSTIPGMSFGSVAPISCPPLADAIKLWPWTRPASAWNEGHFLWRTPDGKPFPYASYSSKQDAWITIIFSGMGGGKSVLMNGLNLGLVLDPSNEELPLIRILDVGPSSSGLTSLISNALPSSESYKSQYHRIRNTIDYAWNPADTPLGLRYPLPAHRDFLCSIINLLCTPLGENSPPEGVDGICQIVVDQAYQRYADEPTSTPKKYAPTTSPEIDDAIMRHSIEPDENTTWWELADHFYRLDDIRASTACHRMAMPLLSDIAQLAKDESIAKLYPDKTAGGLPLPDFFRRKIIEAVGQYKILQRPTKFDISDSSIVSLDLDEVAKRGSEAALRRTTVMYLLSLWQLTGEFFIGQEIVDTMRDPAYKAYHQARIKKLSRKKKRLCADELHRPVESSPMAIQVIDQIIREGRKWGVDVVLASQRHEDFPKSMIDLASCIYIMKPPQGGAGPDMIERFQLNGTEVYNINNFLHGPQAGHGANCFARFQTKDGQFSHLLTNTSGNIELWAFTTTQEDRDIRDELYKSVPGPAARRLLAKTYGSSAKNEIDRRAKVRLKEGASQSTSVIEEMVQQLSLAHAESVKSLV